MILAVSILLKVTLTVLLALAATRLARHSRAAVRHVLLVAAFAVLLILPVASMVSPVFAVDVPISADRLPAPVAEVFVDSPRAVSIDDAGAVTVTPLRPSVSWLSIAAVLWMAGLIVCVAPIGAGLWQVRTLRRNGLPWRDGQRAVDRLAASMGIRAKVLALLHESIPGPMTCGSIRPVILLPADVSAWPAEELNAAIVHELEHVRRRDWTSQCAARVIAACYWFHPVVWIAWRRLVLEAERACDDAVLRSTDATDYADQLVVLAQRLSASSSQPQLAMANRGDLAARVAAVLDGAQKRGRAGAMFVSAAVVATVVLVTGMSAIRVVAAADIGWAQARVDGPKPKYDAASIKRCVTEEYPTGARGAAGGTNATFSPGRFYVPCVTTEQLIYLAYAAYGVPEGEHLVNDDFGAASNATKVRGGPDWVHSLKEKYQIEATAQGATERTVLMGSMLQSLLEDRFHLRLHRETESVDMLAMTVGKSGFKLKPMKDGDCDDSPVEPGPGKPGGKPHCQSINMSNSDQGVRWTFGGYTPGSVAGMLRRTFGTYIIDNTGITDKFVFTFTFPRGEDDQATALLAKAALEDQLGLVLTKVKAPRGFLVIDAIERPTPDGPFVLVHMPPRAVGPGPRSGGAGR